jgi:hypothetical protein
VFRSLALCILTGGCLLAVAASARTTRDDIQVATRVGADSVTVGERFTVGYDVGYPDSLELIPPESFDVGSCRLIRLDWAERASDGRIGKTAVLEVMTADLETAFVPGPAFSFLSPGGDTITVYADDVEVPVRHLIGDAGGAGDAKPLKPQWQAPRSYLWWYLAAAIIAVAAIAAFLLRRYRKREVPETAKPKLPADFVAFRRLDEIERRRLPEAGEFKRYYTLVVDALREYIENRYGVMAMDRTTDEILWDLGRIRVEIEELEPTLRDADLVKFAKHRPDVTTAKTFMETARAIVARTAPRIAVSGE